MRHIKGLECSPNWILSGYFWMCRKYIVLKSLISYLTFLIILNGTLDRKCRTRNDCSGVVLVTDALSWIRDS